MEAQFSNNSAREESHWASDDRVASLFQPDTLLTTQFFENLRRQSAYEPEKRLMLAVLEDGIHCYLDNRHAAEGKRKRLFEDAADWIVEKDGDWVFSFESVCDALGLSPEYVRQGLLRWKEKGGSPWRAPVDRESAKLAG